ncbi:MAG: tRNA pseudouridine(38-40) synthase TruA [Candidatus Brocadiaceae bacterium]|jgi:tRNA pseudouridine38-40 synthase
MRRLIITLEYDGTDFFGWQVQAEGRTVQGAVEDAVRQTTGERTAVVGASRTDSGVHAEGQVAHFDTESDLPPRRFRPALNYWLPHDVSVLDCREANPDFDAQRSAASKLYRYRLLLSAAPRPLRDRFVLREWRPLELDPMRECAAILRGEHDFSSFASEHGDAATAVRRIMRSELVEEGDEVHYMIEGDGFLYHMVRIIVGTLLEVGRGKIGPEDFRRALEARDRRAAGPTAQAKGLTLVRVFYPHDPRG